ncbi:MAG: carbon storage regulator [Oscillospiraceae bacterium]|nr:carbon storage regulator [Oscillospiraceae bacterium]
MLVISRKQDESIIIEPRQGEPIEIKIISIDNQVRIGIKAPNDCKIWRNELYKTVELNRSAAEVSSVSNLRNFIANNDKVND